MVSSTLAIGRHQYYGDDYRQYTDARVKRGFVVYRSRTQQHRPASMTRRKARRRGNHSDTAAPWESITYASVWKPTVIRASAIPRVSQAASGSLPDGGTCAMVSRW